MRYSDTLNHRHASKIVPLPAMYKRIEKTLIPYIAAEIKAELEESIREQRKLVEANKDPATRSKYTNYKYIQDTLVTMVDALRVATKLSSGIRRQREYQTHEKLDMSGWAHRVKVTKMIKEAQHLSGASLSDWYFVQSLNVRYDPKRIGGQYLQGEIIVGRQDRSIRVVCRETLKLRINQTLSILRHEMVHYSQFILAAAARFLDEARWKLHSKPKKTRLQTVGVPPKGRLRRRKKYFDSQGTKDHEAEHAKADVEFYTRLSDSIEEAKGELKGIREPAMRREYLKVYSGQKDEPNGAFLFKYGNYYVGPSFFFESLKKANKRKWAKAVSELVKECL